MGMQGPLTAQALGRSPYDEVVDGDGEEPSSEPVQQYDPRGRPINPETKRINRDIIRAHNEVMLVIGVAEPENQQPNVELESQRRHEEYEEKIGEKLMTYASRSVELVGLLGLHSLRQRILIFKDYSELPFWKCLQKARSEFSITKDVIPGIATGLLTSHIEGVVSRSWRRRITIEAWSYIRVHLELFAAFQRVGLISTSQLLPRPAFFIPFSHESPIPFPGPPRDLTFPSLARWVGDALIAASPFVVWVMSRRMIRDWRSRIWTEIHRRLPSTIFRARKKLVTSQPPPPPPPPPPTLPAPQPSTTSATPVAQTSEEGDEWIEVPPLDRTAIPTVRRQSVISARGDEYVSDEEEPEAVSATLISLDIEATESTDAPPGLWSAELRPSTTPDARHRTNSMPVYFDTMLTRMPAIMAAHILTDAALRILLSPYEATALRFATYTYGVQHGVALPDIYSVGPLRGLNLASAANFLGSELLHLSVLGEVWAVFTSLSQYFHMTEDEWKAAESAQGEA